MAESKGFRVLKIGKNKTSFMKVPTGATSDFNQKASCVTPQLSLGYLFRRIL